MIISLISEHDNIFLSTYPVVLNTSFSAAFSTLHKKPAMFQHCTIGSFRHFTKIELPLSAYCHLALNADSKLFENFQPSSEYIFCSDDNKEKISTSIQSELVSDFCHDRK